MSTQPLDFLMDRRPGKPASATGQTAWDKIILGGLVALIVFSPLPQGSVLEWSVLLIQLGALLLAAVMLLRAPKPAINPYLEQALRWPRRLFAGFGLVVALQVIPLPKVLIRILSPATHGFLQAYSPGFDRAAFATLSLAPGQTLRQGLEIMAYFLLGMVIVRSITRFSQVRKLTMAVIIIGVFEALFGLYMLSQSNPTILFYRKTLHLDSVTGTFVNRNHLAGYLEMALPLTIGFVLSRVGFLALGQSKKRGGWREVLSRMSGKAWSLNLILGLAALVMASALVRSQSRSGLFLLFFSFVLFAELAAFHFGGFKEHRHLSRSFINVAFILILVLSLWIGLGTVVNRFLEDDTLFKGGRTMFWGDVTSVIKDFPVFGTGLGTFASVYPAYEKSGFEMRLTHAHNDYLECFSEVGLLGGLCLIGGLFFLIVKIFLTWRERHSVEIKGLALGGIVSVTVMLLHSLTDFNLHIPANALLFTVILSLTAVTVFHRKSE
jgi:O-antigen ligase